MTKNNKPENPFYPQVLPLLRPGHQARIKPTSSNKALLRNLKAELGNEQGIITMTRDRADKERRDLTEQEQETITVSYHRRDTIQQMISKILEGR